MQGAPLRIEKAVYGGDGLARTPGGEVFLVPFALPGEVVEDPAGGALRVLEPSPDRVAPGCVHFGVCGGCQYQMAGYDAQLRMKEAILRETLERAGLAGLAPIRVWASPEPWGYRNRIRLRTREIEGSVRLGYSRRGTKEFLPVRMCPIAAPVLWATAEALMRAAAALREAADWLGAAAEVEIACDDSGSHVQVHLLCAGAVPPRKNSFERAAQQVKLSGVPVLSMTASRVHAASGRPVDKLASWGSDGMAYAVGKTRFWLKPGSFFQVNRYLVPTMVEIVCGERGGELAWDLFAGVGLFARHLRERFSEVTAVEASPTALAELRRSLPRPADQAVQETTLAFLQRAVLQRERPDLVVLDPPRAGIGEEACGHLLRLAPAVVVYVSCDPTTLARDLRVLERSYRVAELHMIDLFPQTYHLETVMVLERLPVGG